ncbi:MAG: hypothetical protein AMXMBFR56_77570 [Polyangiaceae bacterium]
MKFLVPSEQKCIARGLRRPPIIRHTRGRSGMGFSALPKALCLAACACASAPGGQPAAPVSTTVAAVHDRPGTYLGRSVRVRGWAVTGFQECNFVGRPCPPRPRLLACQRPEPELEVDSPVVTALELRTADGQPLGPAPELAEGGFYEVVGEVDRAGILRVHALRAAKAVEHDCRRPAKLGDPG